MFKFKKTLMVSVAAVLAASSVMGLAACDNDSGSGKNKGNKTTTIQFWGSGDADELKVFGDIVDAFNNSVGVEKKIKVVYSGNHENVAMNAMQLSGNSAPDVIYVEDGIIKSWAAAGYLENLTDANGNPRAQYEGLEEFLEPGKVWEQGINRYRYDINTATSTPDTPFLWALPKDIGPTVLYYNREYLNELDIVHLSLDPDDPEFIQKGYPEKGYFQMPDGTWYFNNRVPMSWNEVTELGQKMQKNIAGCDYGYFTEWWFSYGWSIGGDCVEYIPEGKDAEGKEMGYYELTLNDTTANWIVKDNSTVGVTMADGTHYSAKEIISYTHKKELTESQKGECNELPSMYDAFVEFCSLTAPETELVGTIKGEPVYGKGVSMGQNSIGTQSARDRFSAGTFGMFVGGRWEVTHLRKKIGTQNSWMKNNESWDVAPLPVYKEYDADGNITVHGVQAGHSGSMGLAIARKAKEENKWAAWELVKYIAGAPGQTSQSYAGFCIPNQIELAESDVFLQSDQAPLNSRVFVEAAKYETPGDWWYLKDGDWIDKWANCLNTEVRESGSANHKTVAKLFEEWGDYTNNLLRGYTYNSQNLNWKP